MAGKNKKGPKLTESRGAAREASTRVEIGRCGRDLTRHSLRYISARDKVLGLLAEDKPAFMAGYSDSEVADFKAVAPAMITTKPLIYLVNLSKKNFIAKRSKWLPKIAEWVKEHGGGEVIPMSVEYEEELFEAKKAGGIPAREAVVAAHQNCKSVLPRIIKVGYKALNLIYFFTAGEKEVWRGVGGTGRVRASRCSETHPRRTEVDESLVRARRRGPRTTEPRCARGTSTTARSRRKRRAPSTRTSRRASSRPAGGVETSIARQAIASSSDFERNRRPMRSTSGRALRLRRLQGALPGQALHGQPQGPGQVPAGGQAVRGEGRRHHRVQVQQVGGRHWPGLLG